MSVIAVKVYDERIEIAADSQATSNSHREVLDEKNAKLFVCGNMIIGVSGYYRSIPMLRAYLEKNPQDIHSIVGVYEFLKNFRIWEKEIKDTESSDDSDDQNLIIVTNGKAFYIDNYEVKEVSRSEAIGSGSLVASVIMDYDPYTSVCTAVKAAIKHDIYCGPPIVHYIMEKENFTIIRAKESK
jgi:hypothetical protein